MATVDFLTEETAQKILGSIHLMAAYMRIYLKKWNIESWAAAFEIGRSGYAQNVFSVGDQLIGKYTIGDDEYECPWDIVGFRDVTVLVDGVEKTYKNAPIMQMHYVSHENVEFDTAEKVEATEATAQEGVYYCGYDGTNYTMLNLATGDTIPYGDYTNVYKTAYDSVNAIRYGNSDWEYSWLRQYLNNSGTGWAREQYEFDVLPNNADNKVGFLTYLDAELVAELHPVKVTTANANYRGGGTKDTFDKLFPLSVSEMNMSSTQASADDGEPLEYYKELLESETKIPTGTYAVLIKHAINNHASAQNCRLRSSYLGNHGVWIVTSSGSVYYSNPNYSYRVSPACAIV